MSVLDDVMLDFPYSTRYEARRRSPEMELSKREHKLVPRLSGGQLQPVPLVLVRRRDLLALNQYSARSMRLSASKCKA